LLLQVQNLIERCLQLYMTRKDVVNTLQVQAKIEPDFTLLGKSTGCLEWGRLCSCAAVGGYSPTQIELPTPPVQAVRVLLQLCCVLTTTQW
jgi:hypothetical protein